ncbi:MAG: hypothetical protein LIQ31_07015 [Planctomycetes bacterium]|nr:hypothetical protein [Planctomycetota bacterium]
MADSVRYRVRRRTILIGVIIFTMGLVGGCLIGIFGMRYFFEYFRPSPERMARDRADRIAADLNLGPELRNEIYEENIRHFLRVREKLEQLHDILDDEVESYALTVGALMPDDRTRNRWLLVYRKYFPKGPPPPPPPQGYTGNANTEAGRE